MVRQVWLWRASNAREFNVVRCLTVERLKVMVKVRRCDSVEEGEAQVKITKLPCDAQKRPKGARHWSRREAKPWAATNLQGCTPSSGSLQWKRR